MHKYQTEHYLQQKKAKEDYAHELESAIQRKHQEKASLKREESQVNAAQNVRQKGLLNKEQSFRQVLPT